MTTGKPKPKEFSPEFRERAVRLFREHQGEYASRWAAMRGIAEKLGCSAETLRSWVRRAERDAGERPGSAGLTTDERARLKELERENRELKRANEILRKASAYFAMAELDRPAR
jgi:transposase